MRMSSRIPAILQPEPPCRSRSTTAAIQRIVIGTTINIANVTSRNVDVANTLSST